MYDIIFISYQEPTADKNFQELSKRFPRAQRVHGVKGIHQAHIVAAKHSFTKMFWVVDADAEILDSFNFDHVVPKEDLECVHVWRSRNPINGLEYGYGGVKLLPKALTQNMDVSTPDMTTSISSLFKAMPEVSNITAFNTDPFNTWKSAFRECCKLASRTIDRQEDTETQQRLDAWCKLNDDVPFGFYSYLGAEGGKSFGEYNKNDPQALKLINDFDWLQIQFDAAKERINGR
jgi:hypothetical protein